MRTILLVVFAEGALFFGCFAYAGAWLKEAFDLSYLTHIPHLVVMAPRDTTELREMTHFTLGMNDGPVAVRFPRGSSDDRLPEARTPIQFARAEVLREGRDLTLVAVGSMVGEAWEAARRLAESGIDASVINARFVKPIDFDTIAADALRTGRVVTIEENVRTGGFGQQVRDGLEERGVTATVKIIALPDAFVEHGAQPLIRRDCGLDADGIVAVVLNFAKA